MDEDDIDDILDEELEELEPNVGDNVSNDDIDNDMIRNNDIDDDTDMTILTTSILKRMIQMLSWMN